MIIIRFHGGLGNQMFEYTFYKYMQTKYGSCVKADLSWFDRNFREHQGFELEKIFNIKIDKASYSEIARVHEYYPKYHFFAGFRYLSRLIAKHKNNKRNALDPYNKDNYIFDFGPEQYCHNDIFDKLDISKDWYIEGVYCSDSYLKYIEADVKRDFTFKEELTDLNKNFAKSMSECNSVAIHVRRGDYSGSVFDILGTQYYKNAVAYVRNKINKPVFYIFSDDMDYINEEFTFLTDYIPVHNSGKNSYVDMRLISYCKHVIIANSTFSYWGALLGEKRDSIIIAPKKYKADEDICLARNNWVLL